MTAEAAFHLLCKKTKQKKPHISQQETGRQILETGTSHTSNISGSPFPQTEKLIDSGTYSVTGLLSD